MLRHPPHLERLRIYRPGMRTLPILPPRHIWSVTWSRYMPGEMRLARAQIVLRKLRKRH